MERECVERERGQERECVCVEECVLERECVCGVCVRVTVKC